MNSFPRIGCLFWLIVLLGASAFRTSPAQGLINIDYGAHQNAGFPRKTGTAAVGLSSTDFWNLYSRDDGHGGFLLNGALTEISWSDSTPSSLTLAVQNAPGAWFTLNADAMFLSYLYPFNTQTITSTFDRVPLGLFDLYVYAHGQDPGENSYIEVQVGGSSLATKSTSAAADWDANGWGEDRQYVVFRHVTVPAGQTLKVLSKPGVANIAVINGIQFLYSEDSPANPPTSTPLQITTQPKGETILNGAPVEFSVQAVGTGPLGYQWYHNGVPISSALEAHYGIGRAGTNDAGSYQVIVSDESKVVASDVAVLTVLNDSTNPFPALRINVQPQPLTVTAGNRAEFFVEASGVGILRYQWQHDGVEIPAATEASLTVFNANQADAGNYRVIVADELGTTNSVEAALSVLPSLSSAQRLLNVDYGAHQNPNFGVKTGAAAVGSLGDLWNLYSRDDGKGGFRPDGTLLNLVWSDNSPSTIDLAVTNAAGAWFTISDDPMFFSYLYPLGGGPDILSTFTQLPSGVYDFYIYARGQPSQENGVIELRTDTAAYGVRSTSSAENWNPGVWVENGQYVRFPNVAVHYGESVIIRVKPGSSGLAVINGLQAVYTPTLQNLDILQNPGDQTVFEGDQATFSVTAISSSPISYQWFRNGVAIAGAISANLLLPSATVAQSGSYAVAVSDGPTSLSSAGAQLTVQPVPPGSSRMINIDYGAHLNAAFSLKTGRAAVGSAADVWNLYSRDNPDGTWRSEGTLNGLKWNSGEASTAELRVSNAQGAWYTLDPDAMFGSYLYPISRIGAITNILIGLPAGKYDLYVYAHGQAASENASIAVWTQSHDYRAQTTSSALDWNPSGWREGSEYVRFRGIEIKQGEALTFLAQGGISGLSLINGVQVVRLDDGAGNSTVNDGISDEWRLRYFTSLLDPNAAAISDPDQDGANNYQEFLDGTDPLIRESGGIPVRIETFAGSTQGNGDGSIASATFSNPSTLTLHQDGRVFVTQTDIPGFWSTGPNGHSIRVIENGTVSTWAGNLDAGLVEGPRLEARFRGPTSIVFDSKGNAFISDRLNHRVRKVDPNGLVTTFAGSTAGFRDGIGSEAQFSSPIGMCIDPEDNLYVADFENYRVRKITPQAEVSTYAGTGAAGADDGFRTAATFASPHFVARAPDGSIYVADWLNGRLRKIAASGQVSTLDSGLPYIEGVATDNEGNVYVSVPPGMHQLIKYRPDGTIDWELGNAPGYADGPASLAQFNHFGIPLVLPDGNILIADGSHHIRRIVMGHPIDPLLTISPESGSFYGQATVALRSRGSATIFYTLDGTEPTAQSLIYTGSISVTNSLQVKARLYINGVPVSAVVTGQIEIKPAGHLNLLNIDFGAHLNPNFSRKSGIAALGNSEEDQWNLYSRDGANGEWLSNSELSNLHWSDGTSSSVHLAVQNAAGAWYTDSTDPMFQSYLYPLGRTGNITVQLTRLPPGTYDLAVYAHGFASRENAGILAIGDGRTSGPRSTSSAADWNAGTWNEGGQYVLFSDVTAGSDGTLTVISAPGVSGLAAINGLQLVLKSGPIPVFNPTIADWTFEEGLPGDIATKIQDFSGNGHDSSAVLGAPLYRLSAAGVAGFSSLDLTSDASGGFVTGASSDLSLGTDFTIEVLLRPEPNQGTKRQTVLAVQDPGSGRFLYEVQYDPENSAIRFAAVGSSGNTFTLATPIAIDGRSHHIAVVYKNNEVTLYSDKVFAASGSCSVAGDVSSPGSALVFVGANPTVSFKGFNGVLDRIRLSGEALSSNQFFEIDKDPTALTVVKPLQDIEIRSGERVVFYVAASGVMPLSYEWSFNGQIIPGASSNILAIENAGFVQAGSYTVTVTAGNGQQASSRSQLTVSEGEGLPGIIQQPASSRVNPGEPILLSVSVTGNGPFSYQWQKNGTNLAEQTSAALRVATASAADAGEYQVLVSNSLGTVFSSKATITIQDTVAPSVNITSPAGPTEELRFTLAGTATDNSSNFTLEWERDGQVVSSGIVTAGEFAFRDILLNLGTNLFTVRALDAGGNVTSASVAVILVPSRSLFLPDGTVVHEGERFQIPVQLTSKGDVAAATFEISYDTNYFSDVTLSWQNLSPAALGEVNSGVPGKIRASLVLSGETLAAGTSTLALLDLRLRSIPADLQSALVVQLIGVYAANGDPVTNGTEAQSGVVTLVQRAIVGDNNANERLDVSDASIIMRLATELDPTHDWDIAANDLNGNRILDAGDALKALRVAAHADPQPTSNVQKAPSGRSLRVLSSVAGSIELAVDQADLRLANEITVRVRLGEVRTPVYGASFGVDYPAAALRLENAASIRAGSDVPSTALEVWNLSPEVNNYAKQDGTLYTALSSSTPWTSGNGEMAVLTFKILEGARDATEWHIRVQDAEISAGVDLEPIAPADLLLIGRASRVPQLSNLRFDRINGIFSFRLSGDINARYRLEVSDDLRSWRDLGTYSAASGELPITDLNPRTFLSRFYRAVQIP